MTVQATNYNGTANYELVEKKELDAIQKITKETRNEGSFLDVYVAKVGNIAQIRAATKPKRTITSGTRQQLYDTRVTPVYNVYHRYIISGERGFIIEVDTSRSLYITPFGGNLTTSDSVNFYETFIIK